MSSRIWVLTISDSSEIIFEPGSWIALSIFVVVCKRIVLVYNVSVFVIATEKIIFFWSLFLIFFITSYISINHILPV